MTCDHARLCGDCYSPEHVRRKDRQIEGMKKQLEVIHILAADPDMYHWRRQLKMIQMACEVVHPELKGKEYGV